MDLRARAAQLSLDEIVALLQQQTEYKREIQEKDRQLDWFRRQLFGATSEKRALGEAPIGDQMWLGEQMLDVPEEPPKKGTTVRAYERQQRRKPIHFVAADSRLKFTADVPIQTIIVPNPELVGVPESAIVEISEKVTYRLAQRSPYVVLKYVQKVVKLKDSGKMSCPPMPATIFDRSPADVSFLAGLVADKFQSHLPLYRQHQRLEQAGIEIHRATLTRLVHRVGQLIEPIYEALLSSVLQCKVLTVDESPTPAGVEPAKPGSGKHGHMKTGYFWALFSDRGEVVFHFAPTRARSVLDALLKGFQGKLLADGYAAYESFVKAMVAVHVQLVLAQCWTHTRRNFIEAERFEPTKVEWILIELRKLYAVEERFADADPQDRLRARQVVSVPVVDGLFAFFKKELETTALLPSNPFLDAVEYASKRETELRVFLDDPAVPIDTNHVERMIRYPVIGRNNWTFHVTEVGARYAAMFYSLIQSCRLVGVNPTVYLTDILQRLDRHTAEEVHLLTPRLWKERFSHQPLGSDVSRSP